MYSLRYLMGHEKLEIRASDVSTGKTLSQQKGPMALDRSTESWQMRWWCLMAYGLRDIIWASAWDFQQCGMCDHQSLRSAWAYAQSDQSLCLSLEYPMSVKLLIENHLRFLRIKRVCTCSSESTHVKMPHCWKSHAMAHFKIFLFSALQLSWTVWAILVEGIISYISVKLFWIWTSGSRDVA